MRTGVTIIRCTLLVALLVAAGMLFIEVPATWDGSSAGFHIPLAMNATIACLHMGAAVLFLSTLGAYKAKMRRAYVTISVSIVLTALGTLQLPVLNGFDLWKSTWATSGIVALPFLLSGIAMYVGTRNLGRLVGVKSVLTKASVVLPLVAVLMALTTLLPHVATTTAETAYDASNALLTWSALLNGVAALIVLGVRRHIGAHYTAAMTWLSATLSMSFTILVIVVVHGLLSTATQDAVNYLVDVLAILVGLTWLGAGYTFAATKDY